LQETLGISWYEGGVVGALPMVPDRLSYTEMGLLPFKYPSEWTIDWNRYMSNREALKERVIDYIENYKKFLPSLNKQVDVLNEKYFSCKSLLEKLQ
jgi:hypothetical protein